MKLVLSKSWLGFFALAIAVLPNLVWAKTYTVGMEPAYPPWAIVSQGEFKGIGADAIRAMAKQQGFDIKFKTLPWSSLIPALKRGKIDIITGALSATPARSKQIAFTVPWWVVPMNLLVKKNSDKNVMTVLCCGATIGVQSQTTDYDWLRSNIDKNDVDINIHTYSSPTTAVNDVKNGRIDALMLDGNPAHRIQKKNANSIRIAGQINPHPPQVYTLGVRKGDKELLGLLNKAEVQLYKSGEWKKIIHKYMPDASIYKIPGPLRKDIPSYDKPIPGLSQTK